MHKLLTFSAVMIVSSAVLAGCSHDSAGSTPATTTQGAAPAADQKKGDTTLTGMLSKSGDTYMIQAAGQQPAPVETYAVDFDAYVGQTVTVKGQYSGDTLFVSEIQ